MATLKIRTVLARLAAIALTATPATAVAATLDARAEAAERACERQLDDDIPIDRELLDPQDAADALGRGLALAASRMRPLHATQVVAAWALSDDPLRRLAVAKSLEWQFPLVGDALAIDHLSRDPDAGIRLAAARAAWARRTVGGDPGVLARLLGDPDHEVRSVALRAADPAT